MLTMRTVLFGGAGSTVVFAVLRTIQDGPSGEIVTALSLVAGCVLFAGGVIVDRLDRLIGSRSKE